MFALEDQTVAGGPLPDFRGQTRLYCMNGGYHLQILPDGTVQGRREDGDVHIKHVECLMNDGRKHRAECGAGGSMYVHSEQRRNFQSKPFHDSTVFTLLPPRPRSYGDRGSELLGLQVQGLCCPLRQRPSSGRVTQRATPQSRGIGSGSLTLSSLRGRLESRGKPESRPSTVSGPEMNPEGGHLVSETAETPMTACDNKRHGHPDASKVSELHLYLPSSLCDDEEQDADRGDEPHEDISRGD